VRQDRRRFLICHASLVMLAAIVSVVRLRVRGMRVLDVDGRVRGSWGSMTIIRHRRIGAAQSGRITTFNSVCVLRRKPTYPTITGASDHADKPDPQARALSLRQQMRGECISRLNVVHGPSVEQYHVHVL